MASPLHTPLPLVPTAKYNDRHWHCSDKVKPEVPVVQRAIRLEESHAEESRYESRWKEEECYESDCPHRNRIFMRFVGDAPCGFAV